MDKLPTTSLKKTDKLPKPLKAKRRSGASHFLQTLYTMLQVH